MQKVRFVQLILYDLELIFFFVSRAAYGQRSKCSLCCTVCSVLCESIFFLDTRGYREKSFQTGITKFR